MNAKANKKRVLITVILTLMLIVMYFGTRALQPTSFAEASGSVEYTIAAQSSYTTNFEGNIEVVVNVKNTTSKGIWASTFELTYDESNFEYVSGVASGFTGNAFNHITGTNRIAVASDDGSNTAGVTKTNFVLLTLQFKIKDSASAKTSSFSFGGLKDTVTMDGGGSELTSTFTDKGISLVAPSSQADLVSLSIVGMNGSWIGSGSGSVNKSIFSASAEVPYTTTSAKITPTASLGATLKVNNVAATSGSTSNAIILSVGLNHITVEVTAQDKISKKLFEVQITKTAGNSDTSLEVVIKNESETTLEYSIAGDILTLTEQIPFISKDTITILPTIDAKSTLKVGTKTIGSGTATLLDLHAGENKIAITVTSQSAVVKNYTLIINVANPQDANTLSALRLTDENDVEIVLSSVFSSDTLIYYAKVNSTCTSIKVVALTSDASATITSGDGEQLLSSLTGILEVVVTAQNGDTKIYKVAIIPVLISETDNIKDVVVNGNAIEFYADQLIYDIKVSSKQDTVDISYFAGANLKVDIFGNTKLVAGNNVILLNVEKTDGSIITYTFNIYKQDASNVIYIVLTIALGVLLIGAIGAIILVQKKYKRKEKGNPSSSTTEITKK